MSFANFWENEILDHLFGKGVYNPPTIHVGVSTANPLDDASGLAEPSGGSYARVATAGGDWNAAVSGLIDNLNDVTFPGATGSWGTITYFVLFDAASAGNVLGYGLLSSSVLIESGNTLKFAAGDLDINLD